jgi:hypothetical protein
VNASPLGVPQVGQGSGGVLVLGMHRSGTSAVTRAINLLGVPLCRTDDLFGGDGNNVSGYWESRTLMHFNDELLGALKASWRCPPTEVRMAAGHERREASEAGRLLHWSHPTPQWAWKDPRNCSLLPFWRRALDVPLVAVTVLRHPDEVATSLASQREQFARDEALALWERNMRLVLRDAAGMPMLVTRYDDLVGDPRTWAEAMGGFLVHHGFSVDSRAERLAEFLDRSLRHHSADGEALAPGRGATEEQVQLWETAQAQIGAHEPFTAPPLPLESPSTKALLERNLLRPTRRHAQAWYRVLRRYGVVARRADTPGAPPGAGRGPSSAADVAEVR